MAAAKKYTVDNKERKIFATIAKLSPADLKEIKNYIALGYEIVDVEPPKLTKEEKAERAAANKAAAAKAKEENPFSQQNIEKFLKKDENKALYAEYQARYNEQAGTNRSRKVNGKVERIADEPKYLKSGKPKKKGFANCIGWFTDMYDFNEETNTYEAKKK